MYLTHFGLLAAPFPLELSAGPFFPSRGNGRAAAYLDYTARSRDGFLVLTGAAGSGKSSMLLALADIVPEDTRVVRLSGTQPDALALLLGLRTALDLPAVPPGEAPARGDLENFLVSLRDRGQRVMLLVDDAQELGATALEELRLLADLEQGEEKLLRIVLSGRPELATLIDAPRQEPLRRRVRLRFALAGLEEDETEAYIEHRLDAVEGPRELFDTAVYPLIHRSAAGLPGAINALCDACLQHACVDGKRRVDLTLLEEVRLGTAAEGP